MKIKVKNLYAISKADAEHAHTEPREEVKRASQLRILYVIEVPDPDITTDNYLAVPPRQNNSSASSSNAGVTADEDELLGYFGILPEKSLILGTDDEAASSDFSISHEIASLAMTSIVDVLGKQ